MYDLDSLVSDGVVRVAAMRYPVRATLDAAGKNPVRFTLAQVPGSSPPVWVAVVWTTNTQGPIPVVWVAEEVSTILSFAPSGYHLVLTTGSNLCILPVNACRCGGQLRGYRGWPGARLASVPAPST